MCPPHSSELIREDMVDRRNEQRAPRRRVRPPLPARRGGGGGALRPLPALDVPRASMFREPWIRQLMLAAAAVELVVDKLPATPSRLAPQGIVPRLALGALAAASPRRPGRRRGSRPPPSEPRARPSRPSSGTTSARDSRAMRRTWPSPWTPSRSERPLRAPHTDVRFYQRALGVAVISDANQDRHQAASARAPRRTRWGVGCRGCQVPRAGRSGEPRRAPMRRLAARAGSALVDG